MWRSPYVCGEILDPVNSRPSTREAIARATSLLVGLPLWDAGRAADLAWFIFGARKMMQDYRGNPREVGEYSLHVQCAWRITRGEKVLIGSRDLYYPAGYTGRDEEIPPGFNWDVQGANRLDELVSALFRDRHAGFLVQRIEVGNAGAISLRLEDDMSLEIFPHDSSEGEHWRLFSPGEKGSHCVVRGTGFSLE